jgi:hypothetical protein
VCHRSREAATTAAALAPAQLQQMQALAALHLHTAAHGNTCRIRSVVMQLQVNILRQHSKNERKLSLHCICKPQPAGCAGTNRCVSKGTQQPPSAGANTASTNASCVTALHCICKTQAATAQEPISVSAREDRDSSAPALAPAQMTQTQAFAAHCICNLPGSSTAATKKSVSESGQRQQHHVRLHMGKHLQQNGCCTHRARTACTLQTEARMQSHARATPNTRTPAATTHPRTRN